MDLGVWCAPLIKEKPIISGTRLCALIIFRTLSNWHGTVGVIVSSVDKERAGKTVSCIKAFCRRTHSTRAAARTHQRVHAFLPSSRVHRGCFYDDDVIICFAIRVVQSAVAVGGRRRTLRVPRKNSHDNVQTKFLATPAPRPTLFFKHRFGTITFDHVVVG